MALEATAISIGSEEKVWLLGRVFRLDCTYIHQLMPSWDGVEDFSLHSFYISIPYPPLTDLVYG